MKYKLSFISLILVILMTACSDSDKNAHITYRDFDIIENAGQGTADKTDQSNITTEPGQPAKSSEASVTSEYSDSYKVFDTQYDTSDDINPSINTKINSTHCLVCTDTVNDIIYYVNYAKDNYIYQLKDGISSLVLDKETLFIQLWEGELYYLGYDGNEIFYKNIYKYSLKSGKEELITETITPWMHIDSKGIYYIDCDPVPGGGTYEYNLSEYLYSFESSAMELLEYTYSLFYRDYILAFNGSILQLIKQSTGECLLEIPDVNFTERLDIYQDYLFYNGLDKSFNVINLNTGEKDVIRLGSDWGGENSAFDFTIVNKNIYITTITGNVFKFNISDKTLDKYVIANYSLFNIFTGEDRLFAAVRNLRKGTFELAELLPEGNKIELKELGQ